MWASLIPWPYRLLAYGAALVAFGATCWVYGARHEQALQQADQIDHLQSVIRTERRSVQRMAEIDTRHTQEQTHAKRNTDALIAGLRTGTVRVRQQLAASSVPAIAASPGHCKSPSAIFFASATASRRGPVTMTVER